MKVSKFSLGWMLLAASGLAACSRPQPLNANNDFACRNSQGQIVDDDYCDDDNGRGGHGGMFLFMSSNGYNKRYGHYPRGYNPRAYAGKTTSSFAKAHGISRGGFGSSGRGFSAGS